MNLLESFHELKWFLWLQLELREQERQLGLTLTEEERQALYGQEGEESDTVIILPLFQPVVIVIYKTVPWLIMLEFYTASHGHSIIILILTEIVDIGKASSCCMKYLPL